MSIINLPTSEGQAGRRYTVSLFSQGNIIPVLTIVAVTVLFYYGGLQVYFHGETWYNLSSIEAIRSNFYFSGDYFLPRPVEYAVEDLILSVFGLDNSLPFNTFALGLHAANSLLVFLILKKVTNTWVGLFGALLFTSFFAHPEVVTYQFGISEALRAAFGLSCIVLFYRYRRNPTKTNYILTLAAFTLAVGSKESSAFILPPMLYLVDRYLLIELGTKDFNLNKGVYIPFIIISIVWLIVVLVIWSDPSRPGPTRNALSWYLSGKPVWPINFYLGAITSFNLCSMKGPGSGTSFLLLSFMLSFLPLFDVRTRRYIVLLWVGWLVTVIPLTMSGMHLRFLYISAAFSMAILATCVYHLIVYVAGRFLKEAYIPALIIFVISVPVTTNFLYVNRHLEYLKEAGRLSKSLLKLIQTDFPTSTLGTKLIFINFPYVYEPARSGYIGVRHMIWADFFSKMFTTIYGRYNVGDTYQFKISELYDGRHRLGPEPELSPQEFERLAMEKGTKVYFFNPRNDTILNVTERDYNSLKKLISNN